MVQEPNLVNLQNFFFIARYAIWVARDSGNLLLSSTVKEFKEMMF